MDKQDIIAMAREQGLPETEVEGVFRVNADDLGRFAALVEQRTHTNNKARWYQEGVEAEREASAKVCEEAISSIWEFHPEYVNEVGRNVCTNLAAAIRARGNT